VFRRMGPNPKNRNPGMPKPRHDLYEIVPLFFAAMASQRMEADNSGGVLAVLPHVT